MQLHAFQILKVPLTPLSSGFPLFTSALWNSLFDSLGLTAKEILHFYIFPEVFANNFQSNICLQAAQENAFEIQFPSGPVHFSFQLPTLKSFHLNSTTFVHHLQLGTVLYQVCFQDFKYSNAFNSFFYSS